MFKFYGNSLVVHYDRVKYQIEQALPTIKSVARFKNIMLQKNIKN